MYIQGGGSGIKSIIQAVFTDYPPLLLPQWEYPVFPSLTDVFDHYQTLLTKT